MAKRIILTILLIIWMIVIFMFSNETGEASQSRSDGVAITTINVVTKVTNQKMSKKAKEKMIDNTRVIIRKTAHFTLYFILGTIVYFTLNSYGINNAIVIILSHGYIDGKIYSNKAIADFLRISVDDVIRIEQNYLSNGPSNGISRTRRINDN